jgi:hypothetical protein
MSYSFARLIGNEVIPAATLERLRRSAVSDSHTDAILKEALLDREYDTTGLHEAVLAASQSGDFILNSFPDQRFAGANLLLRSEFMILRETGGERLRPDRIDRYVENTLDRILPFAPNAIIFRCLDYNPADFSFLPDALSRRPDGSTIRSRGAQRLLDQDALLELDVRVIRALTDHGIPVDVLVPFVQFPYQVEQLRDRMRQLLPPAARRTARFGLMLEVPVNLYQIASFGAVDFFIFGPGDLLKYFYGGIDRDDPAFEQVSVSVLLEPLRHATAAIDALGGKEVYFAKRLVDLVRTFDWNEYPATTPRTLRTPNQLARPAVHQHLVATA